MRVAPHAGAWIEIINLSGFSPEGEVAPHAGAWIEIQDIQGYRADGRVAPHAGAWIEIRRGVAQLVERWRRSPRGSVD